MFQNINDDQHLLYVHIILQYYTQTFGAINVHKVHCKR